MIRCKKEVDRIGRLAPVAGGAMLMSLFMPPVRRMFFGWGILASGCFFLLLIALLGIGIYRLLARRRGPVAGNPFAAQAADLNLGNDGASDQNDEATFGVLEPALRRRYPWRHGATDPS